VFDALKGFRAVGARSINSRHARAPGRSHEALVALAGVPLPSVALVFFLSLHAQGRCLPRGRRADGHQPVLCLATLATWLIVAGFFARRRSASIVASGVRAVLINC